MPLCSSSSVWPVQTKYMALSKNRTTLLLNSRACMSWNDESKNCVSSRRAEVALYEHECHDHVVQGHTSLNLALPVSCSAPRAQPSSCRRRASCPAAVHVIYALVDDIPVEPAVSSGLLPDQEILQTRFVGCLRFPCELDIFSYIIGSLVVGLLFARRSIPMPLFPSLSRPAAHAPRKACMAVRRHLYFAC